jgi:hypothetical protein
VFRGDIEIPTPPPPDSEPDDSHAPWELEDLPKLDYDYYQAPLEHDEDIDHKRKLAEEPCYRRPSPQSAVFTRSRGEERSNTPPDAFDGYLADSFRPVTVPLLPATLKTPPPQTTSQRAATTGVAARAAPSSDIVARRLSYSDVSTIRR